MKMVSAAMLLSVLMTTVGGQNIDSVVWGQLQNGFMELAAVGSTLLDVDNMKKPLPGLEGKMLNDFTKWEELFDFSSDRGMIAGIGSSQPSDANGLQTQLTNLMTDMLTSDFQNPNPNVVASYDSQAQKVDVSITYTSGELKFEIQKVFPRMGALLLVPDWTFKTPNGVTWVSYLDYTVSLTATASGFDFKIEQFQFSSPSSKTILSSVPSVIAFEKVTSDIDWETETGFGLKPGTVVQCTASNCVPSAALTFSGTVDALFTVTGSASFLGTGSNTITLSVTDVFEPDTSLSTTVVFSGFTEEVNNLGGTASRLLEPLIKLAADMSDPIAADMDLGLDDEPFSGFFDASTPKVDFIQRIGATFRSYVTTHLMGPIPESRRLPLCLDADLPSDWGMSSTPVSGSFKFEIDSQEYEFMFNIPDPTDKKTLLSQIRGAAHVVGVLNFIDVNEPNSNEDNPTGVQFCAKNKPATFKVTPSSTGLLGWPNIKVAKVPNGPAFDNFEDLISLLQSKKKYSSKEHDQHVMRRGIRTQALFNSADYGLQWPIELEIDTYERFGERIVAIGVKPADPLVPIHEWEMQENVTSALHMNMGLEFEIAIGKGDNKLEKTIQIEFQASGSIADRNMELHFILDDVPSSITIGNGGSIRPQIEAGLKLFKHGSEVKLSVVSGPSTNPYLYTIKAENAWQFQLLNYPSDADLLGLIDYKKIIVGGCQYEYSFPLPPGKKLMWDGRQLPFNIDTFERKIEDPIPHTNWMVDQLKKNGFLASRDCKTHLAVTECVLTVWNAVLPAKLLAEAKYRTSGELIQYGAVNVKINVPAIAAPPIGRGGRGARPYAPLPPAPFGNIVSVNGVAVDDALRKKLCTVTRTTNNQNKLWDIFPRSSSLAYTLSYRDDSGTTFPVHAKRSIELSEGSWEGLDETASRVIRMELKWAPNGGTLTGVRSCLIEATVRNKQSPWKAIVDSQLNQANCPQAKLVYTETKDPTTGAISNRKIECKDLLICSFEVLNPTSSPMPGTDTSITVDLYLTKNLEAGIEIRTISSKKTNNVVIWDPIDISVKADDDRATLIQDLLSQPKHKLDVVAVSHKDNVNQYGTDYQVFELRISGVQLFEVKGVTHSFVRNRQAAHVVPVGDAWNVRDIRLDFVVYFTLEVNPTHWFTFEVELTMGWPIFAAYYRSGQPGKNWVFARGVKNRSRRFRDKTGSSILAHQYLDYFLPSPGFGASAKVIGVDIVGIELSDRFERNKERFWPQWDDFDLVFFGSVSVHYSRSAGFSLSQLNRGSLVSNAYRFIKGTADGAFKSPSRGIQTLQTGGATTPTNPPDVTLREALDQLQGMDVRLPIIGKSVGDFVAPIKDLLTDLEDVLSNIGDNFEEVVEIALGLPDDKKSECYRSCAFEVGVETDPSPVLFMDLNIKKDIKLSSGFDLDLKDLLSLAHIPADQLELISNLVDVSGQFDLVVTGSIGFRYKMGLMLDFGTVRPVIMAETGLTLGLSVAVQNLNFNANLGPLEVTIVNGELTFDGEFRFGLQENYQLSYGLGSLKDSLLLDTTGTAKVVLPMEQIPMTPPMTIEVDLENLLAKMTKREYAGEIVTFSPNPSDITNQLKGLLNVNPLAILLKNPGAMVAGIDGFFLQIQLAVTGAGGLLSTIRIPIVKDKIRSLLDEGFINKFRVKVMEKVHEVKEDIDQGTGGITENSVAGTLAMKMTDALKAAGVMSGSKKVEVEVRDKKGAIKPGVLDASGNLLSSADMSDADAVEWVAELGDVITLSKGFDFDLGLEDLELGLDVTGDINFALTWSIKLRFGISISKGFYIAVGDVDNEVEVSIEMSFVGLKAAGKLLFLEAQVEELQDGTTHVFGGITVDIKDDVAKNPIANQDGMLTFTEMKTLKTDVFVFTPAILARANLHASVGIAGSSGMPSFSCDIVAEYGVTYLNPADKPAVKPPKPTNAKFPSNGSPEGSITFRDVTLDLGSFMSDMLKPILDKISPIVKPVGEVVGKLAEPIPLLSDMGSGDISFIDLPELIINGLLSNGPVRGHVHGLSGYVDMILDIVQIIDALAKVDLNTADGLKVNFGDFVYDIPTKKFAASGAGMTGNAEDMAHDELVKKDPKPTSKNGLSGLFKRLSQSKYFKMPFLQPQSLLKLLMGQDIDIFTIESPKLDVQLIVDFGFDVDIVAVGFYGQFDFNAQIAGGYDTSGIRRAIEQGDPLLALDGFFISDTDIATGTGGVDIPELSLEVLVEASGSVNLGVMRGEASGSIKASASVDLNDPNDDGKVRISEVISGGLGDLLDIKTTFCVSIKVKVQVRIPFLGWNTLFTLGFGGCAGGGGGGGGSGGGDPDKGGNPMVPDKDSTPPPPPPPGGSGGGVPGGPAVVYSYTPVSSNDVNIVVRHISGGPGNAEVEIHIEDPANPSTKSLPVMVQVPSLEFKNEEPVANMMITLINPRIGGTFQGRAGGADVLILDYSNYRGGEAVVGTVSNGVITGYLLGGAVINYSDFSQVIVKLPRSPRVGPTKTTVSPDCGDECKTVTIDPVDAIDGSAGKIGNPPPVSCNDNQFVCGQWGKCVTDPMNMMMQSSCECTSPYVGLTCREYNVAAPAIDVPPPPPTAFECSATSRNSDSCADYKVCRNLQCTCIPPVTSTCAPCCKMYNPPDPSPKAACDKYGPGPSFLDTCFITPSDGQKQRILDFTNKVRNDHGVPPLTWDDGMATTIRDSPGLENICTSYRDSFSNDWNLNPNAYGANWNSDNYFGTILSDGGSGKNPMFGFSGVSGKEGVASWYCAEEGCWNYATSFGMAGNNPPDIEGSEDFVHMISNTNTAMACAMCSYENQDTGFAKYYKVNVICAFKHNGGPQKTLTEQIPPLACRNGGTWDAAARKCQCPPKVEVGRDRFSNCVGQTRDAMGNFVKECTKYLEYTGYFCGIGAYSYGDVHFVGPATGSEMKPTRDVHGDDDQYYKLYVDDKITVIGNYHTCFNNPHATCMEKISFIDTHQGLYAVEFGQFPVATADGQGVIPELTINCETVGVNYFLDQVGPTGRVHVVGDVYLRGLSRRGDRWVDVEIYENGDLKLLVQITSANHQSVYFHMNSNFEYLGSSTPQGMAYDGQFSLYHEGNKWNDFNGEYCGVIPWKRTAQSLSSTVPSWTQVSSITLDDAFDLCEGSAERLDFATRCCMVGSKCDGMYAQCVMDACLMSSGPGVASGSCPEQLDAAFRAGDIFYPESCYCTKPKQAVDPASGECGWCRSDWFPSVEYLASISAPSLDGACERYCNPKITCGGRGTCNELGMCVCGGGSSSTAVTATTSCPHYGVEQNDIPLMTVPVNGKESVSGLGLDLVRIPAVLSQMDVFFPSYPVEKGTTLKVECGDSAKCTFVVVVYHCSPCSADHNLGFTATLPSSGWESASCAPKFTVGGGSEGYPMTAFKRTISTGGSLDLPSTLTASNYVAVFGMQDELPDDWCHKPKGPSFGTGNGCPCI
eukprot:TRINITY_DN322_c0_g1_i9.p1 TRINITY_DN322_c0_g1~~TRINITY_DN322_c0_g1_i9.p1  ORF type:complete len:3456 (+),score=791.11 TRINITY_DN322_c0_g1_i9:121-10488(+)